MPRAEVLFIDKASWQQPGQRQSITCIAACARHAGGTTAAACGVSGRPSPSWMALAHPSCSPRF